MQFSEVGLLEEPQVVLLLDPSRITQNDVSCVSVLCWGVVLQRYVSSDSELALHWIMVCLEAEDKANTPIFRVAQRNGLEKS